MKSVAIVSKPDKPELTQMVPELVGWLKSHGYDVFYDAETAAYLPRDGEKVARTEIGKRRPTFVVVLGGDGTLLSAARAAAGSGAPILGVNLGSLGFLTEVPVGEMYPTLQGIANNLCEAEGRSMLHCRLQRDGKQVAEYVSLNDAVITKSAIARLAYLDLHVDGDFVSNYRGDGLIIATPTGSTAYSLAAGGPILTPSVEGLVITPICPHSLTFRPLVVRDSAEIEIIVKSAAEEVYLSIDGQLGMPLHSDDRLLVRKSEHQTKLLRMRKTFFDVLRAKMKWGR